jgi:UrcA family protein
MTKFRAAAASAVLVLATVAAQAGPSVQVNLRDLNPSDPAVAARVQAAAEVACGPVRYSSDTRFSTLAEADSDHRACIRYAVATAMARVQPGPAKAP